MLTVRKVLIRKGFFAGFNASDVVALTVEPPYNFSNVWNFFSLSIINEGSLRLESNSGIFRVKSNLNLECSRQLNNHMTGEIIDVIELVTLVQKQSKINRFEKSLCYRSFWVYFIN